MTKQQVAELASSIEITKMGMPIGKQDQYASAFGGLNKIAFTSEGVAVEPLTVAPEVRQTLEHRLMLFFTGSSRESTSILKHQRKSTEDQDDSVLQALHHIRQVAIDVHACMPGGKNDALLQVSRQAPSMSATAWRCSPGHRRPRLQVQAVVVSSCSTVTSRHGMQ
jgi:D-glycero-alpha-D-manno-heptose-7-phosphate kinase